MFHRNTEIPPIQQKNTITSLEHNPGKKKQTPKIHLWFGARSSELLYPGASSTYHDEARLMCVEKWMHQKSENSPNPTPHKTAKMLGRPRVEHILVSYMTKTPPNLKGAATSIRDDESQRSAKISMGRIPGRPIFWGQIST